MVRNWGKILTIKTKGQAFFTCVGDLSEPLLLVTLKPLFMKGDGGRFRRDFNFEILVLKGGGGGSGGTGNF